MFGFQGKVRSKYVYFKNFMVRKRDVAIFVAVVLFVIFGVAYLYTVNYQSPEEREMKGIMEGKIRDMDGIVTDVDYKNNRFTLKTLRPPGVYEEYVVYADRKTEFVFLTEEIDEGFVDDFEFGPTVEYERKEEENPASFGDVKMGENVLIFFEERVDPDKDFRLTAKTVKIFRQINNINEDEIYEKDF